MAIYAIGDLHLPGHQEKPMNVFGDHWDRHFDVIRENWLSMVAPEDVVLIPGDISWAMQLSEARDDLMQIAALPGRKLLLRGNHDYWWNSISKVRALLPENMYAIQNDALALDGVVYCGTRGWNIPGEGQPADPQDVKIFQRELLRLEMSLQQAEKLATDFVTGLLAKMGVEGQVKTLPQDKDLLSTPFTEILERHGVRTVVFGHLHGAGIKVGFEGLLRGVEYHLVSCDALHFSLRRIEKVFPQELK